MTDKIKNPTTKGGVKEKLHSDFTQKIISGQIQSGYYLEVVVRDDKQHELDRFYLRAGKAERSLLFLHLCTKGLTRAEALDQHFILSLTQHVWKMRHDWNLLDYIETERVLPTRYARYHLSDCVDVVVFRVGGGS